MWPGVKNRTTAKELVLVPYILIASVVIIVYIVDETGGRNTMIISADNILVEI